MGKHKRHHSRFLHDHSDHGDGDHGDHCDGDHDDHCDVDHGDVDHGDNTGSMM